jgi:hypothetical protein
MQPDNPVLLKINPDAFVTTDKLPKRCRKNKRHPTDGLICPLKN